MKKQKIFFKSVLGLSDEQLLNDLADASMFREWEKGNIVVEIGDVANNVNFLVKGLFRGYYIDSKGQEVTDCFGAEPGTPLVSCFPLESPSPICLEFLEKGMSISVPVSVLAPLMYSNLEILRLYNTLLQKSLQMHWEVKRVLTQYNAEERYKWFLKTYPGMINRINHKNIASFLGITPVSMSRIRSRINIC